MENIDSIITEIPKSKKFDVIRAAIQNGCKYFNFIKGSSVCPGIVTKIIGVKTIKVMELNSKQEHIFTLRKNWVWVEKGYDMNSSHKGTFSHKPVFIEDCCVR